MRENLQIQLCTRDYKEKNVEGGRPTIDTFHKFFGSLTNVAEDGACHHTYQKQAETAMNRTDVEFQSGKANCQQNKGNRQAHALTSGVEKEFYAIQQKSHQAAQNQRKDDFQNGLDHDCQNTYLTICKSCGNAKGYGEQQKANSIINGNNKHEQSGQRTICLILPNDHQGCSRCGCRSDCAESNGTGDGDYCGESQVKCDQHNVHYNSGNDSLKNANDNSRAAHFFQLTETELVSDRKRNEA